MFRILLCFSLLFSQTLYAQGLLTGSNPDLYYSRISEYFYNTNNSKILQPVKLIGAVKKPGIYHIPKDTSITSLLAISGGTTAAADIDSVVISSPKGTSSERNLSEILAGKDDYLLQDGDMIYVPVKDTLLDQDTLNMTIAIATILSVLVAGYAASDND